MAYDMYQDIDNYDLLDEQYPYVEEEEENITVSVSDLLEHCVKPTVLQNYQKMLFLLTICLIFRIMTHFPKHNSLMFHLSSILGGLSILYVFLGTKFVQTIGLVISGYTIIRLLICFDKNYKGYVIGIIFLVYSFVAEFFLFDYDTWSNLRGSQMLASMKILSYSFDVDTGIIKDFKLLDFCGYVLCPANCIFGPWVSYSDYSKLKYNDSWDIKWLQKIMFSFLMSVIFFVISVCFLEWLIPEESNVLWLVYRNAMLFRFGHYFVSYLSEVTSVLSGFGGNKWEFVVAKPLSLELPYSLVQVVINWNIPMHRWLKTYIFKTTLHLGSFVAVMHTYLVSSLLHGFNFRIAAVLLSLGIYTYVEHSFRECLSKTFNACVTSKPCLSYCKKHKRTTRNLIVHSVNLFFMAVAIFHLAYLGVLMEVNNSKTTNIQETFKEWINLHFVSHWTILATFCVYLMIRIIS